LTTTKKREREKRARASVASSVLTALRVGGEKPRGAYRNDVVGYFREVLGLELWPEQANLAKLVQTHDRVAAKSGRRTGKSTTCAGLALWWFDEHEGRAILTSATDRQVNAILWREVGLLRARARRSFDGTSIGVLARTGMRDGTGREIVGFTAREGEAMQGFAASARNPLMFIVDEASGVEQAVFDAIQGNRAGGGKLLLTGNPTKTVGEFFDAFHSKQRDLENPASVGYVAATLSTEEAAKYAIPGLATPEYIVERTAEWGKDSALYRVHVLGEFALAEDGRIFTLAMIADSVERWHTTKPEGPLSIGLDPAGPSGAGDESALAARRGRKVLELQARRGLSEAEHVAWALGVAKLHAPNERVIVTIDRDGPVGWNVLNAFRDAIASHALRITLVPVRSSDRARRRPRDYERVRDELAANLLEWVRDGGAVPDDPKLVAEMHALSWEYQVTGRLKVTRKDHVREELGRSPDRYDALALCCWDRPSWSTDGDDGGGDDGGGSYGDGDDSPYDASPSPYG